MRKTVRIFTLSSLGRGMFSEPFLSLEKATSFLKDNEYGLDPDFGYWENPEGGRDVTYIVTDEEYRKLYPLSQK